METYVDSAVLEAINKVAVNGFAMYGKTILLI